MQNMEKISRPYPSGSKEEAHCLTGQCWEQRALIPMDLYPDHSRAVSELVAGLGGNLIPGEPSLAKALVALGIFLYKGRPVEALPFSHQGPWKAQQPRINVQVCKPEGNMF